MSIENPSLIEVSLKLGVRGDTWRNYNALGIWERNQQGEDGKVEVYIPGHMKGWNEVFMIKTELGTNPDGLPQTKVELDPDRVQYIGKRT